jgi:hypothetical protein
MQLQKQDQVFRNPKIFHVDPKTLDLERVLLNLYMLMKYDGRRPVSRKRPPVTLDSLTERLASLPGVAEGFDKHPQIAARWLESDVLDMIYRGIKGKEQIAAPRPLHLDSYKLRNAAKIRDYNASDQLFSMLMYGNRDVMQELKEFLGVGLNDVNAVESGYDNRAVRQLDLITLVIMRLVEGKDLIDQQSRSNQSDIKPPLLPAQAELMCDDIRRLLAYKNSIPRHILIDYIKIMMGIHLGLYFFRLVELLPIWVETRQVTTDRLPEFLIDMGDDANSRMAAIAAENTNHYLNRINSYIRAVFAINSLLPFAETSGVFPPNVAKDPPVTEVIKLLANPPVALEPFFQFKIMGLFANDSAEEGEKPEIEAIRQMNISNFDKYVELVTSARSKFHRQYLSELVDSTLQKNSPEGLLVQPQGRNRPRRFHIGSRLLEILAQIAVLDPVENSGGKYRTRVMRINDFMDWLRQRYGFVINGVDLDTRRTELSDVEAFRQNVQTLKDRLREIGFYTDLSDAYNAQVIRPRYRLD